MSLTQLKQEASNLPSKEQRELIAFLIALQTEKDQEFKATLAAKIDDCDPSHWISLDQLKEHWKGE